MITLISSIIANAQEQTEILGYALSSFSEKSKSFTHCGLRFVINSKPGPSVVYDGTMGITIIGSVRISSEAYKLLHDGKGNPQKVDIPLDSYWIKSANTAATSPTQGVIFPGYDGIAFFYWEMNGINKYKDMMRTVLEKKPLMIGVQIRGESDTRLFTGVVQMSEKDIELFSKCNNAIVNTFPDQKSD